MRQIVITKPGGKKVLKIQEQENPKPEKQKVNLWMQKILEGVAAGWVRPKVDTTFSFEEVGQAHEYIEMRKNIGKVILIP